MILFTFQMDNILRITRLFGADIFQGFDKERQNVACTNCISILPLQWFLVGRFAVKLFPDETLKTDVFCSFSDSFEIFFCRLISF